VGEAAQGGRGPEAQAAGEAVRTSLRTLLKRRARLRWRALTSKRGFPVIGPGGSWYWGKFWMFQKRGNQKKPKPTWRGE
jgi:hypothetical protein